MSLLHSVMELVAGSRGQLHVLELGATIGLLAATLWRSSRQVSLAILGVCTALISVQVPGVPMGKIATSQFQISQYPAHFLVPLWGITAAAVSVDGLGRRWVRHEASEAAEQTLKDMEEPEYTWDGQSSEGTSTD